MGEPPFAGKPARILSLKHKTEPVPPARRRRGIPAALDSLCVKLLRANPTECPSYPEIMGLLRESCAAPRQPSLAAIAPTEHPFVGRETELARLHDARELLHGGEPVVVLVRGASGSGKSRLVERFLGQLADSDRDAILRGRCFEQESVPFKAVDSLIDSLSRYLNRQPERLLRRWLPRDIGALSRMFPVLERAGPIASAAQNLALPPDPPELRRRAFGALKQLLAAIGGSHPLVLWIDDLQWGDLDSAEMLSELLRGPAPPRLLLLASYRSEYQGENPCLKALSDPHRFAPGGASVRQLDVGPLDPDDARRLAAIVLEESGTDPSGQGASIAHESAGNPYLITEMARHFGAGRGSSGAWPTDGSGISLRQMIGARIDELPDGPRRLLEVIAVAGRPLSQRSAGAAAGLEAPDQSALPLLRREHLVRSGGPGIGDQVEVYHDQIRETLMDRLSRSALCDHNGRLAEALEAEGLTDPEMLADHFASGDQPVRAAPLSAGRAAGQPGVGVRSGGDPPPSRDGGGPVAVPDGRTAPGRSRRPRWPTRGAAARPAAPTWRRPRPSRRRKASSSAVVPSSSSCARASTTSASRSCARSSGKSGSPSRKPRPRRCSRRRWDSSGSGSAGCASARAPSTPSTAMSSCGWTSAGPPA